MRYTVWGSVRCEYVEQSNISPYDVEQLLPDSEDGKVLPLLQESFLLGKVTAGLRLLLHVVCKLLLCSVRRKQNSGN